MKTAAGRRKKEERSKNTEDGRRESFRLPSSVLRLVDGLAAVLLAPVCAACRQPLEHPTHGAVCAACWAAIVPPTPIGTANFPPLISLATAIGPYEGTLKDVVHALKYDRRSTIAKHLGSRMRAIGGEVLDGADAAVPVPLHPARERARGFNQARELARHLDLPLLDVVVRTRRTASQADLPATKRDANVRGAFALARGSRSLDGLVVVLVDDVSTTGATLNACAAPLLAAGVKEVRALTAARAALLMRTSTASEPRERSEPSKRRASERVGESEGRKPLGT